MNKFNSINIPEQLTERHQWIVWRGEERRGKLTKVPYSARTRRLASTTNPGTWASFEEAVAAAENYDGLGFVFTEEAGLTGIDLDICREPQTGEIATWAQEILDALSSYTEISPSESGLHVLVRGSLPPGARRREIITQNALSFMPANSKKKPGVEMYDRSRYFATTGNRVPEMPAAVNERTNELAELHQRLFGTPVPPMPGPADGPPGSPLDDDLLLQKARSAANGYKFERLWAGEYGDFASQSEADLSLCMRLAFWAGRDPARIDRLFRRSGLYRAKWDERHSNDGRTYGVSTVDRAVASVREVYAQTAIRVRRKTLTSDKPEIDTSNRPLEEVSAEVISAIEENNRPPSVFVRGGAISWIRRDENERTLIELVNEAQLTHLAAEASYFSRETRYGKKLTAPPRIVIRDILGQRHWPFPPLVGVVHSPVLRPGGTVLDTPGYDRDTRLVYEPPPDLIVPAVAQNPSTEEVRWALEMIRELIGDFPFADSASEANAIGLLLSPVLRPAIKGPVPQALVNSPKQGTGKSLLTQLLALTATGEDAQMTTAPKDEDEWRKRITAMLLGGSPIIVIDNVEGVLDSPSLASVLTTGFWKDRVLGRTEMIALPQRSVWVVTGNNVSVGGDLARRSYSIRLDAKTECPWMGRKYRHPDLITWAREHRGQLLWALLTIVRSWYGAGQPDHGVPLIGSFEDWSRITGSVLAHVGVNDFLGNLGDMYATADEDGPQWECFFETWYQTLGSEPVTVAELIRRINTLERLRDTLPDVILTDLNNSGLLRQKLGQTLKRRRDAQYGPYKLERAGVNAHWKVATWRVVPVRSQGESCDMRFSRIAEAAPSPGGIIPRSLSN